MGANRLHTGLRPLRVATTVALGLSVPLLATADDPLHRAVQLGTGQKALCRVLTGSNCTEQDVRDTQGYTALHRAVIRGDLTVVRLLLRYGGDKDAVDRNGRTPLAIALDHGHEHIVEELVAAGARLQVLAPSSAIDTGQEDAALEAKPSTP